MTAAVESYYCVHVSGECCSLVWRFCFRWSRDKHSFVTMFCTSGLMNNYLLGRGKRQCVLVQCPSSTLNTCDYLYSCRDLYTSFCPLLKNIKKKYIRKRWQCKMQIHIHFSPVSTPPPKKSNQKVKQLCKLFHPIKSSQNIITLLWICLLTF